MDSPATPKHKRSSKALRVIALFKFLETFVVASAGLASLKLLDPTTLEKLSLWTQALHTSAEQQFAQKVISQLSGMTPHQIDQLGIGALFFASIFLVEGIGLWFEKRWAEWLAVFATSLFMPLEILELTRHASAPKWIALIVNAALVAYLVFRIVKERSRAKTQLIA